MGGAQPMSAGGTETTSEAQKGQPSAQTNNLVQQLLAKLLGGQQQTPGMDLGALGQLLNPRALDPVAQANAGTRDMYGFGDQKQWDAFSPKPVMPATVPPPVAPNAMAQGGLLGGILGGYR